MGSYKVLVYIVQATYTIALLWFIKLYTRGTHLNHSASPRGSNTHLSRTIQINYSTGYGVTILYVSILYYLILPRMEVHLSCMQAPTERQMLLTCF